MGILICKTLMPILSYYFNTKGSVATKFISCIFLKLNNLDLDPDQRISDANLHTNVQDGKIDLQNFDAKIVLLFQDKKKCRNQIYSIHISLVK